MENRTAPRVSIIIPVYNVEKYLEQCIESCINQTLKDIEIILVDDGSTDNSGRLCDSYLALDNRIKVLHQGNGGLSSSRNNGMRLAMADYIMFLDSDDWIDIETCEVALDYLLKYKADLVFWPMIKEWEGYSRERQPIYSSDLIFNITDSRLLHRRIFGLYKTELARPEDADAIVSAWGKLYKKEIIKKNKLNFIDTKQIGTEDVLFNMYYFHYVNKAVFIHRFFSHYRKINPSSLTANHKSTLFQRWQKMFDLMETFIFQEKLGQDFIDAFSNRICLSMINISLSESSHRNSKSHFEKINYLKKILNEKRYIEAYSNLEFKYLKFHWKVFFLFCKYRFASGIYFLSLLMRQLRKL